MDIKEIQLSFVREAAGLGNYQELTKLELANGYCQADEDGDDLKRSQYWAALMLRYWYKIYEWIQNSKSCKLQPEDFVEWLHNSLVDAFYYRSWWWEYEAVVQHGKLIEWKLDENGNKIPNPVYWKTDPNAADKSINYFCAARRGKEYQALNKQKRKANVLTYSLDANQEAVGDSALEDAGCYETIDHTNVIQYIVQKFLKQGRSIEALILDGIANHDSFKEEKTSHIETDVEEVVDEKTGQVKEVETKEKIYDYSYSFDPRRLVKHLNTINQKFMTDYFSEEYQVSMDECMNILNKLRKLNNAKLYNYIKKTLINMKEDSDILSCLQK